MNARPVRYTIDSAWQAWHESQDPLAREWLVVHYASLVKFVAGRLSAGLPRSVDTGDLVSAGVFGLMNAIDRFEPDRGFKFETYAVPRIRGAILDGLRGLDWVPRSVRSRSRSIQEAISSLEHSLGRAPTEEEIADELQISVDELNSWLSDIASSNVGPLDHVVFDATVASDDKTSQPDQVMETNELSDVMREEIQKLPAREQSVLVLYYEDGLTLAEIGEALGVTESRVSQIHSKAVLQLRSRLSAAGLG
jgi:RNA polymerase sigma factor for flagellar operon FliA